MRAIQVKKVVHRDRECQALIFDYNKEVVEQVKRIPGIRWSQTKRFWYTYDRGDLGKYLSAIVTTEKKHTQNEKIKSKAPGTGISSENQVAINEVIRWMRQRQYSLTTCKQYHIEMKKFFGEIKRPWNEIEIKDVVEYNFRHFIEGRKESRGSAQNICVSALKLFFKKKRSELIVPDNLERPKKGRKLPTVLSEDEITLILRRMRNIKHKTLLMIIYSAGLRIGETLNLKLNDINKERSVIEIHGGKGNKDRQVPLSKRVIELLKTYYELYDPKVFVFEGERVGNKYSPRSAQQVFQRAVKRAGIRRRVTLHTLRHSYATHLMERGVGLRYIQDILGHSSPKTTMIYTHVSGKKLRDVVSPLDEMDV